MSESAACPHDRIAVDREAGFVHCGIDENGAFVLLLGHRFRCLACDFEGLLGQPILDASARSSLPEEVVYEEEEEDGWTLKRTK